MSRKVFPMAQWLVLKGKNNQFPVAGMRELKKLAKQGQHIVLFGV